MSIKEGHAVEIPKCKACREINTYGISSKVKQAKYHSLIASVLGLPSSSYVILAGGVNQLGVPTPLGILCVLVLIGALLYLAITWGVTVNVVGDYNRNIETIRSICREMEGIKSWRSIA